MTLGQIAYEAYGNCRDWKVFTGDPMPTWEQQVPELQEAWEAAAQAVHEKVLTEQGQDKDGSWVA